MSVKQLFIKALCLTMCLASSPLSNEDVARELLEHVLRVPNPDQVLKSAFDRFERNRQPAMIRKQVSSKADCADSTELVSEYTETVQGSREIRQLGSQKHYPICHLERKIKKLNTNEYEYRPAYYEEVRCTPNEDIGVTNEICSSLGFACVQWNKTIHLTRRRYNSTVAVEEARPRPTLHLVASRLHDAITPAVRANNDCWETRTMVIPAGCECMWPVHRLGDMKLRI